MIFNFITNRKIASILILVFLVALFWSSVTLQRIFYDAVSLGDAYFSEHQALGVFLFVAMAAFSAMLSPFSSVPLVPLAIAIWGSVWTIVFLIAGWMIGHFFAYGVGYYAGYPFIRRWAFFETMEEYSKKISKKSEFMIVLLFRLAMPAEVPGYILGAARYHFFKYYLATFIAEFPFSILAVYAGEALLERELLILAGAALAGIIFFVVAFSFFRKQINGMRN